MEKKGVGSSARTESSVDPAIAEVMQAVAKGLSITKLEERKEMAAAGGVLEPTCTFNYCRIF